VRGVFIEGLGLARGLGLQCRVRRDRRLGAIPCARGALARGRRRA
jgi:hypothetical protein